MGTRSTSSLLRFLPQVATATLAVVGGPVVVILLLRASGTVTSSILLVAMGVALSIGASYAGASFWMTRAGSSDLLFSDLMVWGWLRRWRIERRLDSAVKLLGLKDPSHPGSVAELGTERRVQLLEDLATIMEARDPSTHGHSRRVARHASMIARRMRLPRDQVAKIRTAAAVHDVGKIDIPMEILNKPGKLSHEELAVIKGHSLIGARMVSELGDTELVRFVRHHHERLDGSGYPDGLAGDAIPLGSRIIAVADTFDTIISPRPYRSARSHKEALKLLSAEAGRRLDPTAVHAFRSYYSGHRPVTLWALLINGSPRMIPTLAAELNLGGAVTAAKITAATLATAALGSAALQSSTAAQRIRHSRSPPALTQRSAALFQNGRAALATVDSLRSHQRPKGGGSSVGGNGASPLAPARPRVAPAAPSHGNSQPKSGNSQPKSGDASQQPGGSTGSGSNPSSSPGTGNGSGSGNNGSGSGNGGPPNPPVPPPVPSTVQTAREAAAKAVGALP